jgi:hypothetical protein
MSKLINCKIIEADIRFFPDFRRSIMEIIFHNELGTGCIQFKPSELFIFKILEKEHLKDFVGSFFRIEIDENGKFKRIYHLIDNYTYIDYEGNLI